LAFEVAKRIKRYVEESGVCKASALETHPLIVVIGRYALRENGLDETHSRFESIMAAGNLV